MTLSPGKYLPTSLPPVVSKGIKDINPFPPLTLHASRFTFHASHFLFVTSITFLTSITSIKQGNTPFLTPRDDTSMEQTNQINNLLKTTNSI